MRNLILALLVALSCAAPGFAATSKLKNNLTVTGNLAVSGTAAITGATTQTGNLSLGGNLAVTGTSTLTGVATGTAANVLTHAATSGLRILDTGADHRISINATSNEAADRALSIPALGGNDTFATLGVSNTFTGTNTFSTPLVKASVNNSVKRQRSFVRLSPETAAAADSTVYKALIPVGRAATVTGIFFVAETPPAGGTDTLKVLKGSSSGNTMLSAATFDATTLVANTISAGTLTATGADLGITSAQPIYAEYSQGSASTDAVQVGVIVEYEITDF